MEPERHSVSEQMKRVKRLVVGEARSATSPEVFHKISLVAFLAWIGLGADGISSACYGPGEAFASLQGHYYLAIILAAMTAATVFIISASYMQIIELFPTGGGGYLVASKLLSPAAGTVSGCALVVDYVLTIIVSIAGGVDALFSFLPREWQSRKLTTEFIVLVILILLNLRGVKESVLPIVPVFLLFLATHVVAILVATFTHLDNVPRIIHETSGELHNSVAQLGVLGVSVLMLHAYSLGGSSYTGIEAVSNGLPILREPRVETGKKTMIYMAISLAFIAGGLILGFLFFRVEPQEGKTLNAVFFEVATQGWPGGRAFVWLALASEALILLVAAQTGFLDGPRVLANMAIDGWMPSRFALLSERLVTENGILLMGGASMILLWISKGSIGFLLVLYSINVFLTFSLSQLGMVKHWWEVRATDKRWARNILINGVGLLLTCFILVTVAVVKFHEGGWLTLVITGSLVALAFMIKQHYKNTRKLLQRLDALLSETIHPPPPKKPAEAEIAPHLSASSSEKTAVVLVNGFGGMGLHTTFGVLRIFRGHFKNFVFVQAGLIDAGQFKGVAEIENLRTSIQDGLDRYVQLMQSHGFYAEGLCSLGTEVVDEVEKLAVQVVEHFPSSVVFTGQLVFPQETILTRILHNYTAFAIQKRLYYHGIPVLILPIRV